MFGRDFEKVAWVSGYERIVGGVLMAGSMGIDWIRRQLNPSLGRLGASHKRNGPFLSYQNGNSLFLFKKHFFCRWFHL